MMIRMDRSITRSAQLVFDIREWFASTFGPGSATIKLPPARPGGPAVNVKTIVRPDTPLVITAEPPAATPPGDARWPFGGPVELVTARSPAGLLAFFGRVRSVGGGPLRRLPLAGTNCRLRVSGPGYSTIDLGEVHVPAPYESTQTLIRFIMPAADYPFPPGPTVLQGGVYQTDGAAIPGIEVNTSPVAVRSAATDEMGRWVLVLDRENGTGPIGVKTDVVFKDLAPAGGDLTIRNVEVHPNRVSRLPQTLLRGRVVRTNAGLSGAKVEVSSFRGESRTRSDGDWLFYPGLGLPLSGTRHVTVKVTAEDGATALRGVTIRLGEATNVPTITV